MTAVEWLSPENVVAVLTALLGVLASGAVLWYERRVPRRKRIGYRVQLDTPIGSNAPGGGRGNVRLGLFNETPDMSDATLVLLRIENDGAQSIAGDDYTGRGVHGLTAEFTDRTVRAIAVTQPADADHLMEHFTPAAGLRHTDGTIHLPRVPLNRGEHYKLLVLLTGGHVGSPIGVTGGIRDGEVRPNRSTTPDDKPPVFSRAARTITVLLTACVIVLASIIVVREDAPPPMGCQRGGLTLTGSTAFAPVVRELAAKYEKDCEGATVVVDAHGSTAGIRALAGEGAKEDKAPALVALSDGPKPGGYPQLREVRVAVSSSRSSSTTGSPYATSRSRTSGASTRARSPTGSSSAAPIWLSCWSAGTPTPARARSSSAGYCTATSRRTPHATAPTGTTRRRRSCAASSTAPSRCSPRWPGCRARSGTANCAPAAG